MSCKGHRQAIHDDGGIAFGNNATRVPLDRACACVAFPGNANVMDNCSSCGADHIATVAGGIAKPNNTAHIFLSEFVFNLFKLAVDHFDEVPFAWTGCERGPRNKARGLICCLGVVEE